jgi:hypothetical protein
MVIVTDTTDTTNTTAVMCQCQVAAVEVAAVEVAVIKTSKSSSFIKKEYLPTISM